MSSNNYLLEFKNRKKIHMNIMENFLGHNLEKGRLIIYAVYFSHLWQCRVKLKARTEYSNVWEEYKNIANHSNSTTILCDIVSKGELKEYHMTVWLKLVSLP